MHIAKLVTLFILTCTAVSPHGLPQDGPLKDLETGQTHYR